MSRIGTEAPTPPRSIQVTLMAFPPSLKRAAGWTCVGLLRSDLAAHIQHVWVFDITWSSGPLNRNFSCVETGALWWKIRVWCESRVSWVAIEHSKSARWLYMYIFIMQWVSQILWEVDYSYCLFQLIYAVWQVIRSPFLGTYYFFATLYLDTWFYLQVSAYYLKCVYIFSFGLYFLPK